MPKSITATEARVHLGALLHRVGADQESFVIERSGQPVAVVLPIAEYEKLSRDPVDAWETSLDQARRARELSRSPRKAGAPTPEATTPEAPTPEEMLREAREIRDGEIADLY